MADTTNPLGTVYTLHEAAEKLRSTPRRVAKIARRDGLCSMSGRDMLFSEIDIAAVWQAMRAPPVPGRAVPSTLPTPGKAYANLLALVPHRTPKRAPKPKPKD